MYGVPTARSVCVGVMLLAQSVIRIMQLWIYGDEGDGEEHPFGWRWRGTAGQHSFWGSCSRSAAVDSDRASAETSPWL